MRMQALDVVGFFFGIFLIIVAGVIGIPTVRILIPIHGLAIVALIVTLTYVVIHMFDSFPR